jgi:hypothetical protein
MQKWEYLDIYLISNEVYSINAKPQTPGGLLHIFLNRLGDEGWELVATLGADRLLLKRQKK